MLGESPQARPLLFVFLAYLLSYGLGFGAMFLWPPLSESGHVNHIIVLGPALAAIIVLWVSAVSPMRWFRDQIFATRPRFWWLLVPVTIVVLALSCFCWVAGAFDVPSYAANLLPLLLVQTLLIALPEELGWRGYLTRILLGSRAPIQVGLFVGIVWALWHAPKLLVLPSLLLGSVALSVVLTYAMGRRGLGIVFTTMVHGSFNAAIIAGERLVSAEQAVVAFNGAVLLLTGAALTLVFVERRWFWAGSTRTRR